MEEQFNVANNYAASLQIEAAAWIHRKKVHCSHLSQNIQKMRWKKLSCNATEIIIYKLQYKTCALTVKLFTKFDIPIGFFPIPRCLHTNYIWQK